MISAEENAINCFSVFFVLNVLKRYVKILFFPWPSGRDSGTALTVAQEDGHLERLSERLRLKFYLNSEIV